MSLDAALTPVTSSSVPTVLSIPGYVLIPNGSRTVYVRSTGRQSFDPPAVNNILTTVNAAAALTRANFGDTVICLGNHVETNIQSTDIWSSMTAGTHIVGVGTGTERPTFTFISSSTATSTFAFNDANVVLDNLVFQEPAATGDQTVGFTVTGASNTIQNSYFRCSGAARKLTTAFALSSAANDFHFFNNQVIGGATAITDTMTVGACARLVVSGCYFSAALGTTRGLITFTAAATDVLIRNSQFQNNVASSTVALKAFSGVTGTVDNCRLGVTVTDGAGVGVAALNTPGSLWVMETYTATVGKASVLSAAATTA